VDPHKTMSLRGLLVVVTVVVLLVQPVFAQGSLAQLCPTAVSNCTECIALNCLWCLNVGCYDPFTQTCYGPFLDIDQTALCPGYVAPSPTASALPSLWWLYYIVLPLFGLGLIAGGGVLLFLYEIRRRKRNAAVPIFHQLQVASAVKQEMSSVSQNSNVNAPVINFNPQITVSPVMNNTGNGGDARNSNDSGAALAV
jgi:hypothetical protein